MDIVKDLQWSFTKSKISLGNGQKGVIGATVPCHDDSTNTFDQWFMDLLLEHVQKNPRRYVLYSINVDVARAAEENDAMLPSNATCILQLLDVAVFSSLKQPWRVI